MNSDLRIIKKYYGENMMHYARDNFSVILETDGKLSKLFLDNFAESKTLYEDLKESDELVKFKNYIYDLYNEKTDEIDIKTESIKTPKELMSEVGYNLYECKTEEDIQSFKKYYSEGEELCTFKGGRLNSNKVFFAVKKDVNNIKRENFKNPKRQDKYGTSVISIQFAKDGMNTLSIKNRYNHRVNNPDATFSNNLDNIIEGLTKSFEIYYGIKQEYINEDDFKEFVRANDGKYYKYNYEINNKYYCPNNIIIDNSKVKKYPKEKYIILDYFILDLVKKEIYLYDEWVNDNFTDTINNINHIEITKSVSDRIIYIKVDNSDKNIEITIDKSNRIISYKNNMIEIIPDCFLLSNTTIKQIDLKKAKKIGCNFLYVNECLENINIPNAKEIESNFLLNNQKLESIDLLNAEYIDDNFLQNNVILEYINIPQAKEIGNNFLFSNKLLRYINLLNAWIIGDNFLRYNKKLYKINMPKVVHIKNSFLFENTALEIIAMPYVEFIENDFLYKNNSLKIIYFPNVIEIGAHFLTYNRVLENIYMPKVKHIKEYFLYSNTSIKNFYAPNLKYIAVYSFYYLLIENGYDINCQSEMLIKNIRGIIDRNNKINCLNEMKDKPKEKVLELKDYNY